MLPDPGRLAAAAAQHFIAIARRAIRKRGRFAAALAGGSTPRGTYQALADSRQSEAVEWSRVQVFWGDERCVPPDRPESNYRMARETLLDHVPIPTDNVHRIQGELAPERAAVSYQAALREFFTAPGIAPRPPRFDLILLGMGADGHAASLFPGTRALQEEKRWVVAQYVEKLDRWRISLTLPVLNAAANVIFLVSGSEKAEALREALAPDGSPELPARMVNPANGELLWLVDAEAAALLRD